MGLMMVMCLTFVASLVTVRWWRTRIRFWRVGLYISAIRWGRGWTIRIAATIGFGRTIRIRISAIIFGVRRFSIGFTSIFFVFVFLGWFIRVTAAMGFRRVVRITATIRFRRVIRIAATIGFGRTVRIRITSITLLSVTSVTLLSIASIISIITVGFVIGVNSPKVLECANDVRSEQSIGKIDFARSRFVEDLHGEVFFPLFGKFCGQCVV